MGILINIAEAAGWCDNRYTERRALLDVSRIESMTGAGPRTGSEPPADCGQTRMVRKADAMIIAPASYNSINRLVAGVADNYALAVVAELVGVGLPTVVVPFVNAALARRAPYQTALRVLLSEGIRVLGPGDQWEPHEPGAGGRSHGRLPWQQAFDIATALTERTGDRHQ
ncbi:flavoprotein [Catellatospora sp. KI3]|uniref:flavoprotein n=1 Tax=Catellatospora sp. KI3 TaxID=3041620 RepID=UPI002482DFB6|nr:flavoprotein [Catellatospora sp. KI3]MDI1461061.1 flavoprotein [Catellatospora sp. KI3]